MTRVERLTQAFTKDMRLIEIGASYNPLIPKKAGWQTTVVDHADQATLIAKYRDVPNVLADDVVEKVDYIWRDGPLIEAIPPALHGTFDGLIASHVGEHMPDLIGFFLAAAKLLKPSGILVLALPDKRLCFDFFQPLTTTGDLLDARGATRHSIGTLFDHAAYFAEKGTEGAWIRGGPQQPFRLTHPFEEARKTLKIDTGDYVDAHTWRFTPASFQLLILELNKLGLIPWDIERLEPAEAVEFYVWMQQRAVRLSDAEIATRRLELLRETVMETKEQVSQLDAPPPAPVLPVVTEPVVPTISAIIPLYNGGKFIEEALRSVLAQTLPPKEIIVVDDGSTDDGPALVRAMAEKHPITLLSKPNGGQSSARNMGVAHSSGELIALLDQDDIWYTTHLEHLIKPFLAPETATNSGAPLGWVYSDLDEVDTDGLMICHSFLSSLPTEHPKRNLFACLREDMFVLPSASLIARHAFDTVGGFDEQLSGYEDDDLFLRLFRAGYNNIFLQQPLSKWRIYPDSSSYSYRMRRSRSIFTRKLLNTYVDDPKRMRFIHRDLLLPRFYSHALVEYRDAMLSGDADRIHETRDELAFLVDRMPTKKRVGRMLMLVRSQKIAKLAFATRTLTRPLYRRAI
jgi:glycosyltransferase involved in cell wall biosynthesis/SAM-dependent methyltransferase